MLDTSGERLLWRMMERLEVAERVLLKPGPSGLGDLVDSLEESWRELCAVELAVQLKVRADGDRPAGSPKVAWSATLEGELEEVRGRVSHMLMLLDHARRMVDGWEMAGAGAYCGGGRPTAPGHGAVDRLLASGRLNEEG